MVVIRDLSESDPIQYLVLWKFPALAAFNMAADSERKQLSPMDWEALKKKAAAYRIGLEAKSPRAIKTLAAKAIADDKRRYADYLAAEESKRIFNRPEGQADFAYWAKLATWSVDEAVTLSLGRDPKKIGWESIQKIVSVSPFAAEYASAREILVRAKAMGQLWDYTIPALFVAWAKRVRLKLPQALAAEVEALGFHVVDWKDMYEKQSDTLASLQNELTDERNGRLTLLTETNEHLDKMGSGQKAVFASFDAAVLKKDETIEMLRRANIDLSSQLAILEKSPLTSGPELGTRERESLLKLVIGMAIKGYSHNPTASRSPTSKEIASDLALIGLGMDEDTVRKYLAEARLLLPGDETEQGH